MFHQDWDEVTIPSGVTNGFYVWDVLNTNDGIYATNAFGFGLNGGSNIIPHFQAFFVKTSGSNTLTFENDDRITDPATQGSFFKSSNTDPVFRLLISGLGYQTETLVRFKSGATNN
jgi:hypothetical protein